MKTTHAADSLLLACLLALCLVSIVFVTSASLSLSEVRYQHATRIISHWLLYMPIGFLLMWQISRLQPSSIERWSLPFLLLALLLIMLLLIPGIGAAHNGAKRWFSIAGFSMQPVELLKPAMIMYMAYYMARFPNRLKQFSTGLAPMLVILGFSIVLLLLQPDFGSSMLLLCVCFGMWFVGGVPIRHLLTLCAVSIPLAILVIIAEPYRVQRMLSFTDPWADPYNSGYQLIQSMIAFGSGGISGVGIGQGVQKLFYLPEPFTDFISATIGEELGFLGILAILLLFALLLTRSMRIAFQTENDFCRLLACGCCMVFTMMLFINMGAAMGLLPTKGMSLPFISYGGSSLWGNFILMGLLFSIQRHEPTPQHATS